MVLIRSVDSGSLADMNGIKADDVLLSVNGHEINDVLDYRFYLADREAALLIKRGDEQFEVTLKNHGSSEIGLEFDTPLMDKKRCCANKCIFCFIDQNPCGMRDTIYFKDDDSRLSFIHGNYITLTNLFERDVERIIKMRISPVRVSVHTTNPELRCQMMKNKRAGDVLSYLGRFADAGLELNGQIVLCRGINDGDELERSMTDLEKFCPALTSVSIVPAGLTKHRDGLYDLRDFTKEEAGAVIDQVNAFGKKCLEKHGSRIFFCADEFYIKAGREIPSEDYYEDYAQLDNGVGMLRSFEEDFKFELEKFEDLNFDTPRRVSVATGYAAYDMIAGLVGLIKKDNFDAKVYRIRNDFYGESVTVSGLLTGQDIAAQLKDKDLGDELLIPANALRYGENVFLDDMTTDELSSRLGNIKITPSGSDGIDFLLKILGQEQ